MKVRLNFVSNSSSSSFVMILDKCKSEELLKDMHPYMRALVDSIFEPETFLGNEVIVYHKAWDDSMGEFEYCEVDNWDGETPQMCEIDSEVFKGNEDEPYFYDLVYEYLIPKYQGKYGKDAIFSSSCDY